MIQTITTMLKKMKYLIALLLFGGALQAQVDWSVNSSDYEYSMTITGVLSVHDSVYEQTEGIIVGAFVDDTICVGKAEAYFYDKVSAYRVPLMVYANANGQDLVLKAYMPESDTVYTIVKAYEFSIDGRFGNYGTPIMWNTDLGASLSKTMEVSHNIYPNPASDYVYIENVKTASVKVLDASGKVMPVPMLDAYGKTELDISNLRVGFYLISIESGIRFSTQKLMVK
jgi:hypothetical protein